MAIEPPPLLGLRQQPLHLRGDVVHIETGSMEGAVGRDPCQHLCDGADAPLLGGLGHLYDDGRGPHPDDHPMAPAVERQCRLFHVSVGGGRARGEEAGADPAEEVVRCRIVGGHDDHTAATPGPDPVFRHRDCLCCAGARRVDLGIRAAGADELSELGVPHGQDAEQETAIEGVRVSIDFGTQRCDVLVQLST